MLVGIWRALKVSMSYQPKEEAKFGRWRSFFWPIHRWELKKFLPMLAMFFFISFNYNSLRSYKDSMVVTAAHSGAEAIPFIKLWAILPAAFLLTYIFTRLANRYSQEKVFYLMMGGFLTFFFLFTFVLFPAQHVLHPNTLADTIQSYLPGFKGIGGPVSKLDIHPFLCHVGAMGYSHHDDPLLGFCQRSHNHA
jgi:AAA family ATP:ADP antiporter